MLLCFLAIFFVVEALMASCQAKFGHTTGIIVMIGILISFIVKQIANSNENLDSLLVDLRFKDTVFFDLILPLIIFPSGFNMRRKKFFANIGTIMKFGFVGTIICFTYYTGLLLAASYAGLLRKDNPNGDGTVDIEIGVWEIISICSLLCSSDVIAAISMISYKDQPKLFSIVYGEGVFNDIVSIILFRTVNNLQAQESFSPTTPFQIIWQFILLALASLSIGLGFGILSSLLFKYCRFLCHSAITETILLLIIAMITYYISETCEFSGIISLLSCGISMAHYTWYNLSPQGKTISSVTFSILGSIAESIVFAYIGLCVFTYTQGVGTEQDDKYYWSLTFILWMTLIVIVGRVSAVLTAHGLFSICQKKKDVTCRELVFISYGGMIRGAIAFGLVLQIPAGENEVTGKEFAERGVVVTTTLAVVIITTVIFGSFMPVIQSLLFPPQKEEDYDDEDEIED